MRPCSGSVSQPQDWLTWGTSTGIQEKAQKDGDKPWPLLLLGFLGDAGVLSPETLGGPGEHFPEQPVPPSVGEHWVYASL